MLVFLILQNHGASCLQFPMWWTWTSSPLISVPLTCCLVSQKSLPTLPSSTGKADIVLDHTAKIYFFSFGITQVKRSLLLLSNRLSLTFRAKPASLVIYSEGGTISPRQEKACLCSILRQFPQAGISNQPSCTHQWFSFKRNHWRLSQKLVKCFWPCGEPGRDEEGGWRRGDLGELMNLLLNTS